MTGFLLAAAALLVYAVVGGLVVEPAPWAPAGLANESGWFDATGFPLAVLRGLVALVLLLAVIKLLDIFEVEAEQPRRHGPALQAAVDPVRQASLEGAEPRVLRKLGVGRAEPVEEELGCARARAGGVVAQSNARLAQAETCDLVHCVSPAVKAAQAAFHEEELRLVCELLRQGAAAGVALVHAHARRPLQHLAGAADRKSVV